MRKLVRKPSLLWGMILAAGSALVSVGKLLKIDYFEKTSLGWLFTSWLAALLVIAASAIDAYRATLKQRRGKDETI